MTSRSQSEPQTSDKLLAARWVTTKVHPCRGCTRCRKVHICLETVPQVGEGEVAPAVPAGCPPEAPSKSVQAATNISDLFRYHDHQIQQAAVEEIQKTGGKGGFFLFAGYDELLEELRTKNSISWMSSLATKGYSLHHQLSLGKRVPPQGM